MKKSLLDTAAPAIKWRHLLFVFLGLLFVFFLDCLGLFRVIDDRIYDLSFRIRGARKPGMEVLVVAIDEKTLSRYGRWPLDRTLYATLLGKLESAAVVGFDIIFREPSGNDWALEKAMSRHGRVVLPVYAENVRSIAEPLPFFHPAGVGHVHLNQDVDGVTRSVFHTINTGEKTIRSFSSVVFQVSRRGAAKTPSDGAKIFKRFFGRLSQNDFMKIDYYGPPGTFNQLSLADVLEGKYETDFFRGRIVIVGLTAKGLEGELITPFTEKANRMAGIEVHANIIEDLIDGKKIRDVTPIVGYMMAVLFAAIFFILFLRLAEKSALLLWVFGIVLIALAQLLLFSGYGVWFPPLHVCFVLTVVFVAAYLIRLSDAVRELDNAYSAVFLRLRHQNGETKVHLQKKGIMRFVSLKGINLKVAMLKKVTAQMLLEKTLADVTLLSNIYGIAVFGRNGNALIINDRARDILAAVNLEAPSVEVLFDVLKTYIIAGSVPEGPWTDERARSFEPLTLALSQPRKMFLKMDLAPVSFENNDYLAVVFTDITSIKEEEIRKGEMVSVVTHELSQPLTAIIGYSYLIAVQSEGQNNEYALTIHREGERMSRFINAFLNLSRLESGRYEPNMETIDPVEVVVEAINSMDPLAATKNIALLFDRPQSSWRVRADRDLLKQCVENLLENAVKYSPTDKSVNVRFVCEEKQIFIRISDNGYGINRADMASIFEKFFRGTSKMTKGSKGSGLGLSFVKEAVEAMGGTVQVQSEEGVGSVFTVALPEIVEVVR